jgi:hypothetical protein
MSRRRASLAIAGASALVFSITAAARPTSTPIVGPPWISIEYPANPLDASTRGALLLVHAFHHGTPMDFPVTGTAEGLVDGERKSVSLEFTRTSRPGVYALRKQWPAQGTWSLVITVSQAQNDVAQALVEIGRGGEVASVRVPTEAHREGAFPRRVTSAEVETSLKRQVASR